MSKGNPERRGTNKTTNRPFNKGQSNPDKSSRSSSERSETANRTQIFEQRKKEFIYSFVGHYISNKLYKQKGRRMS